MKSIMLGLGALFLTISPTAHAQELRASDILAGAYSGQPASGLSAPAGGSGLSRFTLTVTGPDGYVAQVYGEHHPPAIRLADFAGPSGGAPEGLYQFQLTAATSQPAAVQAAALDNGRTGAPVAPRQALQTSGVFRVTGGRIVAPSDEVEP